MGAFPKVSHSHSTWSHEHRNKGLVSVCMVLPRDCGLQPGRMLLLPSVLYSIEDSLTICTEGCWLQAALSSRSPKSPFVSVQEQRRFATLWTYPIPTSLSHGLPKSMFFSPFPVLWSISFWTYPGKQPTLILFLPHQEMIDRPHIWSALGRWMKQL